MLENALHAVKVGVWTVLGGIAVWLGAQTARAVLSPVVTAFSATGAKPQGFSVNAWVEMPGAPGSLRPLAQHLAAAAHIAGALQESRGPTWSRVWVKQEGRGFASEAIVERLAGGQTYLVLDRAGSQGFGDLSATVSQFRRVLSAYEPAVHLAFTLQGSLSGLYSPERAQAVAAKSLRAVSARPVNALTRPRLVSVAGYTPFLRQSERVDGQALNVQVALTWNTTQKRTDVYVGTPLITVPY